MTNTNSYNVSGSTSLYNLASESSKKLKDLTTEFNTAIKYFDFLEKDELWRCGIQKEKANTLIELKKQVNELNVSLGSIENALNTIAEELNKANDSTLNSNSSTTIKDKVFQGFFESLGINNGYIGGSLASPFLAESCSYFRISSDMGWRTLNNGQDLHKGLDLVPHNADGSKNYSAKVGSISEGVVTISKFSDSAGNYVQIKTTLPDTGQEVFITYMHMAELPNVKVGDIVEPGTVLGIVGNTGDSNGMHLDLKIQVVETGEYIDPLPYIVDTSSINREYNNGTQYPTVRINGTEINNTNGTISIK